MNVVAKDSHQTIIRFDPGEEVVTLLKEYCISENIAGSWISGLGSSREMVFSYYNLETRRYEDRTVSERLEIAALTGNLAYLDGEPAVHLHGVLADKNFAVTAGHVKKLVVSATCEIRLSNIPSGIGRIHDVKTGLNILK